MSEPASGPRVFISYSHDSSEHRQRVHSLCEHLRSDGVDAFIDQYVETAGPPEGWPRWMDTQLREADLVVLVCTAVYRRRVEGREAPGRGHGVMWEGTLVYQLLYNAGTRNERFIPVLLSDAGADDIPLPLQAGAFYRADDANGYEALYRRLTGQPRVVPIPVGARRTLPPLPPLPPPADGTPPAIGSQAAPTPTSEPAQTSKAAGEEPHRSGSRTLAVAGAALLVVTIAIAWAFYASRLDVYRIRIEVVDVQGQPVGDAKITSASGGELQRGDGGWLLVLPASSRPADGVVSLHASVPSAFLAGDAKVKLSAGAPRTVRLQLSPLTGATVSGIVVDSLQRPLAGALVSVAGSGASATTSGDGRFQLPAGAAVGQIIELRAERAGALPVTQLHPAGNGPATIVVTP